MRRSFRSGEGEGMNDAQRRIVSRSLYILAAIWIAMVGGLGFAAGLDGTTNLVGVLGALVVAVAVLAFAAGLLYVHAGSKKDDKG